MAGCGDGSIASPTTSSGCSTRTRRSSGSPTTGRPSCAAPPSRSAPAGTSARWCGATARPSWCCCTAAPRTPTPGTRWRWRSGARSWPSTCRATATPTRRPRAASTCARTPPTSPSPSGRWRPTRWASSACRSAGSPRSRSPTATPTSCARSCSSTSPRASTGPGAAAIVAFVNGPESFADFDELLARTIEFNPTRSESSLRRGILHNALQRDDGSWVWRYRRFTDGERVTRALAARRRPLGRRSRRIAVPLMLVRGMRPGSVVDDEAEAELVRRSRGPASSTSPRPATASRATTPSAWPPARRLHRLRSLGDPKGAGNRSRFRAPRPRSRIRDTTPRPARDGTCCLTGGLPRRGAASPRPCPSSASRGALGAGDELAAAVGADGGHVVGAGHAERALEAADPGVGRLGQPASHFSQVARISSMGGPYRRPAVDVGPWRGWPDRSGPGVGDAGELLAARPRGERRRPRSMARAVRPTRVG